MKTKRKASSKPIPVPPDSVRVWCGYRLGSLSPTAFVEKLGTIFIPGTEMIQAPLGLTAYLPTVLPQSKPEGLPDEVALVFYGRQKDYTDAKKTVGGRAYSDMHALVFDLGRSISGFPDLFGGMVKPNGRYHLFKKKVDWQQARTTVFVGARGTESQANFRNHVVSEMSGLQNAPPGGLDGAIFAFALDYVVLWQHWQTARKPTRPALPLTVSPVLNESIPPVNLKPALWSVFKGFAIDARGKSFNLQFPR
jgi:hypothetical protein